MKKLLSLAAIIAIVVTTFAFTAKKAGTFCVTNPAGTACQLASPYMIDNVHGVMNGYWPGYFNEQQTPCALASPITQCNTPIKLAAD